MKSKILKTIAALAIFVGVGLVFNLTPAFAAEDICKNSKVSEAVKDAAGCNGNTDKDAAGNLIVNIINWVMGILGFVAVIAIIIGGVQYMTSTGDPGKVKKAKDTILYAVIGLIIIIFAAAIVNFVIDGVTKNNSSAPKEEEQQTAPASNPTPQDRGKSPKRDWQLLQD